MNWEQAFKPLEKRGMTHRDGQALLGQAIIEAFHNKTHLVNESPVGTGKSAGYLIPMITTIIEGKKKGKYLRGVVSTETLSLQSQLNFKDMPFLMESYKGIKWAILKGRTNYLCMDQLKLSAIGWRNLDAYLQKLEMRIDSIDTGEKYDIEKVLGHELSADEWKKMSGSSTFCADNDCKGERCFTMKARKKALTSDIVICNHAVIQTDLDMKQGASEDGLLGDFNFLVIDEAHSLAGVLIDGWTETLSEWELHDLTNSITKAVAKASTIKPDLVAGHYAAKINEDLSDVLASVIKFYGRLNEKAGNEWDGSSTALSLKYVVGTSDPGFLATMREYEEDNPQRLSTAAGALTHVQKYLNSTIQTFIDEKIKGKREVSKGIRACKKLLDTIEILEMAMASNDGVIFHYGVNYGILVDGWTRKKDQHRTCTIRMIPLDISSKVKILWGMSDSSILTSGTLRDPVRNNFDYARTSLGFPESATELVVNSPFDFHRNQKIYITPATQRPTEGTVFSMNELTQVIGATHGGTLVLCTSKKELALVAEQLRAQNASGKFPYNIYVQEDGVDKQKLADAFKNDHDSVLVGLKSFFVGISIEGDSLRHVSFPRFPMERFSTECRMQMGVWQKRGFPDWYQMKTLESFNQGKGRLIRTVTDRGIISMLDIRLRDPSENAFRTAGPGITAAGSEIINKIDDIKSFMLEGK